MRSLLTTLFIVPLALLPAACGAPARPPVNAAACPTPEGTVDRASAPTVEEALVFIKSTEQEMLRLWVDRERATWVKSTYITHDTGAHRRQGRRGGDGIHGAQISRGGARSTSWSCPRSPGASSSCSS